MNKNFYISIQGSPILKILSVFIVLILGILTVAVSLFFTVLMLIPGVRQLLFWGIKKLALNAFFSKKMPGVHFFHSGSFNMNGDFQEDLAQNPIRDVTPASVEVIEAKAVKL